MHNINKKKSIILEKAFNVRDLGGYITRDGRQTSDIFLRGDSFEVLSESDRKTIMDLGVKTVIDLRNSDEIERTPSVFMQAGGVEYCNIPIFPNDDQQKMISRMDYTFIMGDLYTSLVDNGMQSLCKVFKKMAFAPGRILFHCSAGKDRTGIVAAFLLRLANVDDEAIVYDYCLTEKLLAPKLKSLQAVTDRWQLPQDILAEALGAKAGSMEKLLRHMDEQYKGIEAYLLRIGLSQNDLEALKGKMVGPETMLSEVGK